MLTSSIGEVARLIGLSLQVVTNGMLKSIEHRVVTNTAMAVSIKHGHAGKASYAYTARLVCIYEFELY